MVKSCLWGFLRGVVAVCMVGAGWIWYNIDRYYTLPNGIQSGASISEGYGIISTDIIPCRMASRAKRAYPKDMA